MQFLIGTSGWAYPHWRGRFYPADLPPSQWLDFYARTFPTVEINRSFYRLPGAVQFAAWRQQTPDGFVFSVKAGRFITHMKKLTAPERTLPPLLSSTLALQDRGGPILFQLPPRWRVDVDRLRAFVEALPRERAFAFELRDPSWHIAPVVDLLSAHKVAFCVFDLGGRRSPRVVTADFAYVRLHGPHVPYSGEYGATALREWAAWLRGLALRAAYVYLDNDEAGYAVRDAIALKDMLA